MNCKFCGCQINTFCPRGKRSTCNSNECKKKYNNEWKNTNYKERAKQYNKVYRKNHKKEKRDNQRRKYNTDEKYRTEQKIRHRFREALKSQNLRKNKSIKLYGINIQSIINHLGPCPGNRKDYHIDHIKPLSLFDLRNECEIRIAFAPSNHQWLRAEENLSKHNKF